MATLRRVREADVMTAERRDHHRRRRRTIARTLEDRIDYEPSVNGHGPSDHGLAEVPDYPAAALPQATSALFDYGAAHGIPATLMGGSLLAAGAAAIGASARLDVTQRWRERAILWVANIAPRGAGKSPAQEIAFAPLREHDSDSLLSDVTLEALARVMDQTEGTAALDIDELAQLLRGIGEYKNGSSGDRGRLLTLWSGQRLSVRRVGSDRKGGNAIELDIAHPTLVICGGLQPSLHALLGAEDDGLRPRWLPHLAMPDAHREQRQERALNDTAWEQTVLALLEACEHNRRWTFSTAARKLWEDRRQVWKREARGAEPPSVTAALVKADIHLARIALVLAELDHPGRGGEISRDVLERAAEIVAFTLDCWRALPEHNLGLGLSRRDAILSTAVGKLAAWLEERPERRAARREIQRACVAGARKASDLKALLDEYEQTYPGSITEDEPPGGGRSTIVVVAPRRKAHT